MYLMNYDVSTGDILGFYIKLINRNIPQPTIEITEEKHDFYMDNNSLYRLNPQTLEDELIPIIPVVKEKTEIELLKEQNEVTKSAINYILLNY